MLKAWYQGEMDNNCKLINLTDSILVELAIECTGCKGMSDISELDGLIEFCEFDEDEGDYIGDPVILDRNELVEFIENSDKRNFYFCRYNECGK